MYQLMGLVYLWIFSVSASSSSTTNISYTMLPMFWVPRSGWFFPGGRPLSHLLLFSIPHRIHQLASNERLVYSNSLGLPYSLNLLPYCIISNIEVLSFARFGHGFQCPTNFFIPLFQRWIFINPEILVFQISLLNVANDVYILFKYNFFIL